MQIKLVKEARPEDMAEDSRYNHQYYDHHDLFSFFNSKEKMNYNNLQQDNYKARIILNNRNSDWHFLLKAEKTWQTTDCYK